ncbi:MAG: DHH family phosphoesterase [Clostridia bacterium]|nr:DHH family phosphoesterase [Clostridia bacterium]
MNNKNNKKHIPYASRTQLSICVMLSPIAITLYALIKEYTNIDSAFLAVGISLLYLLTVSLVAAYHSQYVKSLPSHDIEKLLQETGSSVFKTTSSPVIAVDSYGTVLWYNDSMHVILDEHGNYVESNISSLLEKPLSKENFAGEPITLFGRLYTIEAFELSEKENGLYIAILSDVTDFSEIKRKYADERVAVAYIAIDNVEDILQYVHEKFKDAVASVDDKIKAWASSMNGIVKSYDNDKYIVLFDSAKLDECIDNRFEILDDIRNSRVGDGVSVTVSIGVSKATGSLKDREAAAREAIDMALQRGGDQVVYKTENSIEYYGGRTKSLYKRSNVRSRTFTNQLSSLITRADNVIVMGHRYGDFDSIGASVGVARLSMLLGIKVNVAVDMRDANLQPCIEMMQRCEDYSQVFIDSAEAFDLVSPDTLVVLVDHNNFERSQFSDIAKRANKVVIIDHHRKIDVMPESVDISYIEPSASSTCELLAEMLEVAVLSQNIKKEEADLLLSGILLDTKQFTRNTGTRTFGAAQYLQGAGASPTDVYDLFKTSPDDLAKESRFHTSITVYRNNIAISCCDGDTDDSYRIVASKAADKMLTLKDVSAAFTMVKIGEQIHISGRSNGTVNVQAILEKLHGGGHFDVAGAQIKSDSVTSVLDTLKASIDDYLDQNENNKIKE